MHRSTKASPKNLSPFEAVFGQAIVTKHTLHAVELGKEKAGKADLVVGEKVWVRMFQQVRGGNQDIFVK